MEEEKETKQDICCMCGKEIEGFGNNPRPVKNVGRCCDKCNEYVMVRRMAECLN